MNAYYLFLLFRILYHTVHKAFRISVGWMIHRAIISKVKIHIRARDRTNAIRIIIEIFR